MVNPAHYCAELCSSHRPHERARAEPSPAKPDPSIAKDTAYSGEVQHGFVKLHFPFTQEREDESEAIRSQENIVLKRFRHEGRTKFGALLFHAETPIDTEKFASLIEKLANEEPLTERSNPKIRIHSITLDEIFTELDEFTTKEDINVSIISSNNILTIATETTDDYDKVAAFITDLDIVPPQFLFEFLVVDAVNWNFLLAGENPDETGQEQIQQALDPNRTGFGFVNDYDKFQAILQKHIKSETAQLVASPSIVTHNKKQAQVTITKYIPYRKSTTSDDGEVTLSTERMKVGTTFEVTPTLTDDGTVSLALMIEHIDFVGYDSDRIPITSKKTIKTTMGCSVENTVFIRNIKRSKNDEGKITERIIFVTSTILDEEAMKDIEGYIKSRKL